MDSLLGTWSWAAALRRDLLSIPCHIFRMVCENRGRRLVLWPSVRLELKAMRAAIPLCRLNLDGGAAPFLFATDAMGVNNIDHGGYGIVARPISRHDFEEVFRAAKILSFSVAKVDGDTSGFKRPERALDRTIPGTPLPDHLFEAGSWRSVDRGRWCFTDHVTLGEGRAVVRLLRRLVSRPEWHRQIILSLQDNRPIVGAFTKGRRVAFHVNRLCRMKAAAVLAGDLRVWLPWCESVKQPADHDSRLQ